MSLPPLSDADHALLDKSLEAGLTCALIHASGKLQGTAKDTFFLLYGVKQDQDIYKFQNNEWQRYRGPINARIANN
jgi:hypothetical protein